MNVSKKVLIKIGVTVVNGKIVLTGGYNRDVITGFTIIWESDYEFNVKFDGDNPFIIDPRSNGKKVIMFVPENAQFYRLYKYTIAVFLKDLTITSDPIIVIVPPEERQAR
jgi:hypothetical protein